MTLSICKKCGKEFKVRKGFINYCSTKCRNGQNWTEKDKLKKSIAAKKSKKILEASLLRTKKNKENGTYNLIANKIKERAKQKILTEPFESLSYDRLRKRVLYEQDEKCNRCGLDTWQNEKLVLELEHKDGNHENNIRVNLEGLCPNCHSLTKFWRGRNKRIHTQKVSDKNLFNMLLKHNFNMRQALLELGMAAKGGNYKRCHRLLKEYKDLKNIS